MAANEKELLAMLNEGMIDQSAFDTMLKDLQAEKNKNPVTEVMTTNEGIKLIAGAYSSKGMREQNEDSFFLGAQTGGAKDTDSAFYNCEGDGPFFFAAADGMGGHDAGDVASAFVVSKLKQNIAYQSLPVDDIKIEIMLKGIHSALLSEARERGTPKMGSTVAGIVIQKEASGFFNAGDSRVYRLRHNYLQQISEDDSLSRFVPNAAKNIITNAVGAGQETMSVASRFSEGFAVKGDVFLMCSDGVHGFINDDDLAFILNLNDNPQDIARIIVEKAIKNNSDDNCTAVIVKYI